MEGEGEKVINPPNEWSVENVAKGFIAYSLCCQSSYVAQPLVDEMSWALRRKYNFRRTVNVVVYIKETINKQNSGLLEEKAEK